MEQPYLIQRGRLRDISSPITGIDQIVAFDYMGSAEFEFGALPKSLKKFTIVADNLKIYETEIEDYKKEKIYIISSGNSDFGKINNFILQISLNKYRLKEYSRLFESLNNLSNDYMYIDFWWDIENNYMFVIGKENAENVKKAIIAVRDRKRKDKEGNGWY